MPPNLGGLVQLTAASSIVRIIKDGSTAPHANGTTMTAVIDVGQDPVAAINDGLTLGALTADETVLARGERAIVDWSLSNQSGNDLCIPTDVFFPQFHTVGVFQRWIKRLGPDSEIQSIPSIISRDGEGRYAAGGAIIATEGFLANPALWPTGIGQSYGDAVPFYPTDDFPPGEYRIYVEFLGRFFDLNQTAAVDVQFH